MKKLNKSFVNYKLLSKLAKEYSETYIVRVGILGDDANTAVEGTNRTMEQLGAIHEFGCVINVTDKMRATLHAMGLHLRKDTTQIKIPPRSFLRASLLNTEGKKEVEKVAISKLRELDKNIGEDLEIAYGENIEGYSEQKAKQIKKIVSAKDLAMAVAYAAKMRVLQAFESDGFGKWQPITQFTRNHRTGDPNNPILVDTGQLKSSIKAEIEEI